MPDLRPPLPHRASRLLNRIGARGPAEVLQLTTHRIRDAIRSDDTLLVFTRAAGGEVSPPDGLTIRLATAADAAHYARDIGTDSKSSFASRLSDRTHCFLVLRADLIVHSSWVTTAAAWTREIHGYMKPPPGHAYVYESFTRVEVRGRGVYPFALRSICAWAGREGIERVWVAVEEDNPASIRAVEKAGFEEGFRFSFRRRLGRLQIDPAGGEMAHLATNFVSRTP